MVDWSALLAATGVGIIMVVVIISYQWRKYTKHKKEYRERMINWYDEQMRDE